MMLRLFQLYLPVLFPSWRFFEAIGAGLRVEYRRDGGAWTGVVPRSERLTLWSVLTSLVWNRAWNEHLFIVTCAERLLTRTSDKAEDELVARLSARQRGHGHLTFRIVLEDADGPAVAYESDRHEF